MRLSNIDLNLLVTLRALLAEQHVGRAARRLNLSQPAVSRALARLRDLFDDPLLVREGQQMRRTPRADGLVEPLEQVLAGVVDLVTPSAFVPASARGAVRIALPDILVHMLVPPMLRRLSREAPLLDVEVVPWAPDWQEQLARGDVDLTIGHASGTEPGLYEQPLITQRWACVLRRDHPALAEAWTVERYAALPHLLIGFTSHGAGHVDHALAERGLSRRVALRMPYVVLSPLVVAESDLVLTTARWLAEKLAASGLVVLPPPIPLEPVELPMLWRERSHRNPRHRWLRELLRRCATEVCRDTDACWGPPGRPGLEPALSGPSGGPDATPPAAPAPPRRSGRST